MTTPVDWFLKRPEMATDNLKIAPIDGKAAIDTVIRYEFLEEDITSLNIEGLWETFAHINAKSNIRPQTSHNIYEFYKKREKIINQIAELCRDEIVFFNYEIPTP